MSTVSEILILFISSITFFKLYNTPVNCVVYICTQFAYQEGCVSTSLANILRHMTPVSLFNVLLHSITCYTDRYQVIWYVTFINRNSTEQSFIHTAHIIGWNSVTSVLFVYVELDRGIGSYKQIIRFRLVTSPILERLNKSGN